MNYSYLSQFKTPFENSSVKRKNNNSGITARISAIPVQILTNTDFCSQGILMFKDQYRAVMQYSLPRDGRPGEPPRILHDWICSSVSTYYSFCLFFVKTLHIIANRFPKGQLISKCLFGVYKLFQKKNKNKTIPTSPIAINRPLEKPCKNTYELEKMLSVFFLIFFSVWSAKFPSTRPMF